jgi:hypothetical protein
LRHATERRARRRPSVGARAVNDRVVYSTDPTRNSYPDEHLAHWKAHGTALVCARHWRDDRFLAVAVDEAATGASGCSIDGLFRVLARIEPQVGTTLTDAGAIYWRVDDGKVARASRPEFRVAATNGAVSATTPLFEMTVNIVHGWREQFERPVVGSWYRALIAR